MNAQQLIILLQQHHPNAKVVVVPGASSASGANKEGQILQVNPPETGGPTPTTQTPVFIMVEW